MKNNAYIACYLLVMDKLNIVNNKEKQRFEDAVLELMSEGESEMVDIGQPLTREFDNAFVARERANRCSRFIQPDGDYGEWGRLIDASLS